VSETKIIPIVLTGGPCSGKTTAQPYLMQKLADRGIVSVCVQEVATDFIQAGFFPGPMMSNLDFQFHLMSHMVEREERWHKAAHSMNVSQVVLFLDRGLMDARPYCTEAEFEEISRRLGLFIPDMRDARYDAVFHLRSAALGAREFYTCENNPARREGSPDEAAELDEKTLQAWVGAPHLRVIDNSTGFDDKLKRLFAGVCQVLGIPEPLEIERKLLIEGVPDLASLALPQQTVDIEQHYLISDDTTTRRIRMRGQDGYFAYFYTEKEEVSLGVRIERERLISEKEYMRLRQMRDPKREPIHKRRTCFVWHERYFELDVFSGHQEGLVLLEVELGSMDEDVDWPPFLNIKRDVTGEPGFSNQELARRSF